MPKHLSTSNLGLACIVAALALPVPALADCVDGTRQATAGEVDFANRGRGALIAALPAPPAGMVRNGRPNDINEPASFAFCGGTPVGAFSPSVAESFLYKLSKAETDRRAAERRQLQQQIEELEKLPPEKEAQRKALEDQMRAAYAAAPRRSRSDPPLSAEQQALADRQNAEGRRLEDQARRVESDHRASVKAETAPLRARIDALSPAPEIFTLRLEMNVQRFPAAGPYVLTFGAPSPKRSEGLKVHNVVLEVGGPEGAGKQAVLAAVDRSYLQGLVGAPLPDLAASRARVASTAAATPPAGPDVSVAPAAADPAAAPAAGGGNTAPVATTSASPNAPCPPPARSGSSAADAGAAIGGQVLGGGWGASVGRSLGGALGALGGAAKPEEPRSGDCPR
jgi:hypothetical protein